MTEVGLAKVDLAVLDQEPQAKQKQKEGDLDLLRFVKQPEVTRSVGQVCNLPSAFFPGRLQTCPTL